jgi:hypothetical protein
VIFLVDEIGKAIDVLRAAGVPLLDRLEKV